ncbi:MAG: hypothetical protein AAF449_24090, partial [Myxococcota bacterium]
RLASVDHRYPCEAATHIKTWIPSNVLNIQSAYLGRRSPVRLSAPIKTKFLELAARDSSTRGRPCETLRHDAP